MTRDKVRLLPVVAIPDACVPHPCSSLNWDVAMSLYERAVVRCSEGDDEGGYDALMDTPPYTLRARQAAMILAGGHGLNKDPNRAGNYTVIFQGY